MFNILSLGKFNKSTTRFFVGASIGILSPIIFTSSRALADSNNLNGCKSVVGTYLATANQTNSTSGPFSYREIITFTADGNVIANDSTAGGVPGSSNPGDQPFGAIQGSWKCTGNNQIVAKTLNFGFPSGSLSGNIVLSEYQLTFNPQTGTVNGNDNFNVFDLNKSPLDQNTQPLPNSLYEFSYQGVKLKAK